MDIKDHGSYWEFSDGSCYDYKTGDYCESREAMCNGRLWESKSNLNELADEIFGSKGSYEKKVDISVLTDKEKEFYKNYFQYQ